MMNTMSQTTSPASPKEQALDVGGYEMGFNLSTNESRERDKLDISSLAPPDILRTMHDHQMPRTALPSHQFSKPSRHAPWKSEAERVMLGSEVSMGRQMARSSNSDSEQSRFISRDQSPSSSSSSCLSQHAPFTSPVRIGRPGTSEFKMQNSNLYARVASSINRSEVSRILDDERSLTSSIQSRQSTTSTMPKPAPSPQLKYLTGKGDNGPETRSPYARFDLIPQQFTNPVVQDLWNEVSNTNVGPSQERDESFLVEEGLPRRLPSNVSSLESSAPMTSASDPTRFGNVKQDAEKLWANREGRARVAMPDGYHPTYSSTERFKLEQPLLDATGIQRPATSMTTYHASYGLNQIPSSSISHGFSRCSSPPDVNNISHDLNKNEVVTINDGEELLNPTFSSIGSLAHGASAPHAFDITDMDKHYKIHHEPRSVSRRRKHKLSNNKKKNDNDNGDNDNDNNEVEKKDSNNSIASLSSGSTIMSESSSSMITRRQFSPSFGMRSSVHDFFSGPRSSVNGSEVRRDGKNISHSHFSVDAKFHAEKFYQVRHADSDYDRLRNSAHFYRITPSNAKIGPPLATNESF